MQDKANIFNIGGITESDHHTPTTTTPHPTNLLAQALKLQEPGMHYLLQFFFEGVFDVQSLPNGRVGVTSMHGYYEIKQWTIN